MDVSKMDNPENAPEVVPMTDDPDHRLAEDDQRRQPSWKKVFSKKRVRNTVRKNFVILATLVGIIVGFCLGMGIRELNPSSDAITWLGIPGELFLRSLKMTIVPLLVSLIINTTSSFNPSSNGKIAVVAVLGFILTQAIAASIAILLFFVFKPDVRGTLNDKKFDAPPLATSDVFADLVRNIFPDNIVRMTIAQAMTRYTPKTTNSSNKNATEVLEKSVSTTDGINILGLITICTTIGIATHLTTSRDGAFRTFFRETQQIMMLIIRWLFWTTPVGVASLIAASVAQVKDLTYVFKTLGLLIGSVTLGLFIHVIIVLPAILFLLTRKNPFVFLVKCAKPYMVAFAATATSVALPDMLASGKKCGVHPQVNNFVIPMSVSLHADGSTLYMVSSALFIGQISNSLRGAGTYVIIGVLGIVLGLAIPPVPSSSIVCLVIILSAANIPAQDIAMLFAVEWLLDRLRSGVIAVSHIFVAIATDALCKPSPMIEKEEEQNDNKESPADEKCGDIGDYVGLIEYCPENSRLNCQGIFDGQHVYTGPPSLSSISDRTRCMIPPAKDQGRWFYQNKSC